MHGNASHSEAFLLDTSPLIYLAKIGALDVLTSAGAAWMTPAVRTVAILPASAVRFPEVVAIEVALGQGHVKVADLTTAERDRLRSLDERVPGLGRGEREVMAVALERRWDVVLYDRRAMRIARALGASAVDVFELLIRGTPDPEVLRRRVRALGALVDLRLGSLMGLLERVDRRR